LPCSTQLGTAFASTTVSYGVVVTKLPRVRKTWSSPSGQVPLVDRWGNVDGR
jgi:hypothetical protein